MAASTVQEPLRDRVGRAIYEEPDKGLDWYALSEERREPWRQDADRAIAVIAPDYSAVLAEKERALRTVDQLAEKIGSPDPFQ